VIGEPGRNGAPPDSDQYRNSQRLGASFLQFQFARRRRRPSRSGQEYLLHGQPSVRTWCSRSSRSGVCPRSQSDGAAIGGCLNKFRDMIYLPIETSGEGEVNAHSRVQMALGEAKVKAKMEFEETLKSHRPQRLDDMQGLHWSKPIPSCKSAVLSRPAPPGNRRDGRSVHSSRERSHGFRQPLLAAVSSAGRGGRSERSLVACRGGALPGAFGAPLPSNRRLHRKLGGTPCMAIAKIVSWLDWMWARRR
jgi:hypothetical protein